MCTQMFLEMLTHFLLANLHQLRRHLDGKMLVSIQVIASGAPGLKRNRGNDTWIDDLLHATQAMLASQ